MVYYSVWNLLNILKLFIFATKFINMGINKSTDDEMNTIEQKIIIAAFIFNIPIKIYDWL